MTTWKVEDRATSEVVYAYTNDIAIDWPQYPFAQYNHTAVVETPVISVERTCSKRSWRLLFTGAERSAIDRFNATFETNPILTEAQRDAVRSGLEDYNSTLVVNKDDPATAQVLGLYVMLGLLDHSRIAEILS